MAIVEQLRGRVGTIPAAEPDAEGLLYTLTALEVAGVAGGVGASRRGARRHFTRAALSPCGTSVALATAAGHLYVATLAPHRRRWAQLDPLAGPAAALAWGAAAGRRLLFVAESGGALRCYNLATRAFETLPAPAGRVRALAVSSACISSGSGGSEQLAAADAGGVALLGFGARAQQRRRLMGAAPGGSIQVRRRHAPGSWRDFEAGGMSAACTAAPHEACMHARQRRCHACPTNTVRSHGIAWPRTLRWPFRRTDPSL